MKPQLFFICMCLSIGKRYLVYVSFFWWSEYCLFVCFFISLLWAQFMKTAKRVDKRNCRAEKEKCMCKAKVKHLIETDRESSACRGEKRKHMLINRQLRERERVGGSLEDRRHRSLSDQCNSKWSSHNQGNYRVTVVCYCVWQWVCICTPLYECKTGVV